MEDFIHLHVHTYYSILDGQSSIKRLVNKAIGDGMKGMAITDHGDMFGIKEFHDICNDVNKGRKKEGLEPFKPIFGCEMYVARRGDKSLKEHKEDLGGYHLIVLAKNANGYKNLIKLVSNSWVDGFYNRPRTDRMELEKYHEDLIVCSACIAGEVPAKILKGDMAFIGPRPILTYHPCKYEDYTEEEKTVFTVRPGISGWAQVNGRNSVDWEERFKLNEWYVQHVTLWLDIKIVFMTIAQVFSRKEIVIQGETAKTFKEKHQEHKAD